MRLFVAVPLVSAVRRELARAAERLAGSSGGTVRWVAEANLHLTLKFLGEVEATGRADLCKALSQVLDGAPGADLEVRGLGTFPPKGPPRVLWAGLAGETARLEELARAVDRALEPVGHAPERRPFRCHITLGRVRRDCRIPEGLRQAVRSEGASLELGPFRASRVVLYRSHLRPGGPRYEELESWSLGGGGPS